MINGVLMSLAARKSDVKNDLSHSVKKHLNPFNPVTLPDDSVANRSAMKVARNSGFAKIDLGQRPSSEGTETQEAGAPRM
jgi:hypothetical protein